ncbi:MAG: ABC transporter ATP-binding protein [Thermoleophilia bacterium]|nr:ABC transporter ATP-binding protein [Thermoleophilia bacterium]
MGAAAGRVEAPPGSLATEAAIVVESVCKRFGDTVAVDSCTLHVEHGAFVSLLGPSGCGKTTLLRIVGGFESQDSGRVVIHGEPVDRLPPNKRPVNMVFQRYALFPHKSVFENIAFPLEVRGVGKKERAERVKEMLELVRLPGVERRRPEQLSGGQAQRIALARALVSRPPVLLLDEPLTALDLKLRKAMQLELRRIQEELGTTFLYVTHDQEEALTMSDRIVLMNDGRIVQEGVPTEIYNRPANVFASHFIGEANVLEGVVATAGEEGTLVRVDGLEIAASSADVAPGQKVAVSIRPERLSIVAPADASGDGALRGVVARRVFLGNLVRWLVELAPGVLVTVEGAAGEDELEEGSAAYVRWPRDAALVLPAE